MRGLITHDLFLNKTGYIALLFLNMAGALLVLFEFNLNSYNGSVAFLNVISFLSIILLLCGYSVMSDKHFGWYEYVLSTPINRKNYVKEKYILCFLLIISQFVLFTIFYLIIKTKYQVYFNFNVILFLSFFIIILFLIFYPLQFTKKYKNVYMIVSIFCLSAESLFSSDMFSIGKTVSEDNYKLILVKELSYINVFIWLVIVICLFGLGYLSYIISVININKELNNKK